MRSFLRLVCLLWLALSAERAAAQRLDQLPFPAFGGMALLGRWHAADSTRTYSDIWGYAAPDGREYAIIGSLQGTHFIDVTVPTAPRLVATVAGRASSSWRDFKTWGTYAYAVADAGPHSLQVMDLSSLPDTVRVVYDSDSLLVAAHTCFIENGRLYAVSAKYLLPGAADLTWADVVTFDLRATPARPRRVGIFSVDSLGTSPGHYSHAAFVRRDTLYLSTGHGQEVMIFDFHNPTHPTLAGRVRNYASAGYNHSSWTTTNGRLAVVADEVPQGLPLKLFDLTNLSQPRLLTTFNSTPFTTPHNPYIVGDRFIVASAYQDGVQVWDLLPNPEQPRHLGGFDTRPENDTSQVGYSGYNGCWGVYPFLPSGTLLASDIQRGLFVLQPPYPVPASPTTEPPPALWPNPVRTTESLTLAVPYATTALTVEVTDVLGRAVCPPTSWAAPGVVVRLPPLWLAPGSYWLRILLPNEPPHLERLVVVSD